MKRSAAVTLGAAMVAAVLVAAGTYGWLRAESPARVAWTPEPWAPPLDTRLMDRDFRTTDSLIISGSQIVQRSRGTLLLVHGLGDHQAFLSRDVGLLAEKLNYHVVGLPLRGTARAPQLSAARYAYDRDLAAAIGEIKRREPSGPVIFVGIGAGAALVARYLEQLPAPAHLPPDGVVLLHPLVDDAALLTTPLAWHTAMRVWPRRLRLIGRLHRAGVSVLDGMTVAETERPIVAGKADRFSAGAVLGLTARDAWRTWRTTTIPTLLLSPAAPDSTRYVLNETHTWRAVPATAGLSVTLSPLFDEFLASFAAAAEYRLPVPGSRVVPIIQK